MTKSKVCGLTRPEDIRAVNAARPDYAGFVFAPSRRQVSPEQAGALIALLDTGIRPVGVFVDAAPGEIAAAAALAHLQVVQLHGSETEQAAAEIRERTGCEVWKAFRVRDLRGLERAAGFPADKLLLDAYHPGLAGGTGQSFDWTLLDGWRGGDYLLAGGLDAENVADAIRRVRPFGVDVSSGVETGGRKDPAKIEKFMQAVRRADQLAAAEEMPKGGTAGGSCRKER